MSEKKPYKTTASAGFFVAGQRVPSLSDEDGVRIPKVGHILYLTDEEAKYELLQQSIEPADQAVEPTPLAPPTPATKAKRGKAA
ncbi:hypothetical protein [Bosea sp. BK604]|uniref:hypothetical protein n=1 Tax=Bosea sp. BK604 TaxID=2512180 RepID=UPI0010507B34|nr:hypothetical protein [Bosea sp. BK604]TCR70524.1 hypothetical protein EV560_101931 [Bosea sp. BK604]